MFFVAKVLCCMVLCALLTAYNTTSVYYFIKLYVNMMYVGAVYYMLGNIHPRLRSSIHGIQLLLLAKYTTLEKYGIDTILDPLVEDLQKLVSL